MLSREVVRETRTASALEEEEGCSDVELTWVQRTKVTPVLEDVSSSLQVMDWFGFEVVKFFRAKANCGPSLAATRVLKNAFLYPEHGSLLTVETLKQKRLNALLYPQKLKDCFFFIKLERCLKIAQNLMQ